MHACGGVAGMWQVGLEMTCSLCEGDRSDTCGWQVYGEHRGMCEWHVAGVCEKVVCVRWTDCRGHVPSMWEGVWLMCAWHWLCCKETKPQSSPSDNLGGI